MKGRKTNGTFARKKREVISAIKRNIKTLKVDDKVEEINTHIENVKAKDLQPYLQTTKKEYNNLKQKISNEQSLGVLLVLLSLSAKDVTESSDSDTPTLGQCCETIIKEAASKLKDHMEQVHKGGGQQRILHAVTQYASILQHEVFPKLPRTSKKLSPKLNKISCAKCSLRSVTTSRASKPQRLIVLLH